MRVCICEFGQIVEEAMYRQIRIRMKNLPIGVIPIDSIYTPITRVNYTVENTRVGQVTNYDKLTLEVWTDGSIRPEEAVSIGAKIFTEHLMLFVGLTDEARDAEIMVEKEEDQERKSLGDDHRRA